MPEVAHVYADALFEVGKERGKLDSLRDQLGQFADAVDGNRDLQVFFFSPYFSSADKQRRGGRAISGAEPEFVNFLALLIEKQRMPEIFRIRRQFDELWKNENRRIDVTVISAVELDPPWSEDRRRDSSGRPARRSSWPAASTTTSSAASSCR